MPSSYTSNDCGSHLSPRSTSSASSSTKPSSSRLVLLTLGVLAVSSCQAFQSSISSSPTTKSISSSLPLQGRTLCHRRPRSMFLRAFPSNHGNEGSTSENVAVPATSTTSATPTSTALPSTVAPSLIQRAPFTAPLKRWLANRRTASKERQEDRTSSWTSQNMAIALPALLGLVADPVLSMVDTGFVGRMGPMDLAALGVCTSIFHMCFTIFRGSTVATTSLINSAQDPAEKRHIAKISLQLAGLLGSVVLLALRFGGSAMLTTMGVHSGSPMYKPACDYLFSRCWAAPAVVGIVVAEGTFRGNDDSKTPLVASAVAAALNLILDPLLMFPLGMGMAGAAVATAVSQVGAAGVYGFRLWRRRLLPQKADEVPAGTTPRIIKSILGANLAMLAKQGSMLVFYTLATALATRMGPMHVATHQIALSLFWLVTMWLDSGSVSSQVLMGKNLNNRQKAKSLTKYMAKYSLVQGLAFSTIVAGVGGFVPGVFTQDAGIQSLLLKCLPHLALQQTLVSMTLTLEGLAIGGNQFRYMAAGTLASTVAGIYQLQRATSVVGIWSTAVNTFFGARLLNSIIGVTRMHLSLKKKGREESLSEDVIPLTEVSPSSA